MNLFSSLKHAERSMLNRLIASMLALTIVILTALFSGLFLFGRITNPGKRLSETLQLQMEFFENNMNSFYEETYVTGNFLSQSISNLIETSLDNSGLEFKDLNNNPVQITAVQENIIEPLSEILLQSDCSGAFVMLDTTVNSSIPEAESSKSGLYLQKNESKADQKTLLLYRGNTDLGKANHIMPHRKWRLEFRTDLLPSTIYIPETSNSNSISGFSISEMFTLPGTSERAVLMSLPLCGSDGTVYGICGFELSQSYFQMHMAQPTNLKHMTCIVAHSYNDQIFSENLLSCGVANGSYLAPSGILNKTPIDHDLYEISGSTINYVAVSKNIDLFSDGNPITLAVMVPKSLLDNAVTRNIFQIILLLLLLLFFTISCCIFFSKRYLGPILKSLEQIRSEDKEISHSGFQEIDDLFGFLALKDREHEDALMALEQEKKDAQSAYRSVKDKYDTAQSEIARLAYTRSSEIDPYEYQIFIDGIKNLTPTENLIFGYYLEGKNVKEILDILGIKESTLRYHNRNIYSKLGVNSLKQLLRYAALMKWQDKDSETPK